MGDASPWSLRHGGGNVSVAGASLVGATLRVTAPAGAALQWLRDGVAIAGATGTTYIVQTGDQGHALSCQVTTTTGTINVPAGSRPPLTDVLFVGDSFTLGGNNGDATNTRFSTVAAASLGVTEHNFGHGGAPNYYDFTGTNYILAQVNNNTKPPAAAPYAPTWQACVIQASINNLKVGQVINDLGILTEALARAIHRLRSAGYYDMDRDRALYALTGAMVAGSGRATGNASYTLNLPADFPGGILRVHGNKYQAWGGVETFTVDGAGAGSVDNRDAVIDRTDNESWEFKTAALAAGAHTIRSDITSVLGTGEFIFGADFEMTSKPLVVVCNIAHAPGYPGGAGSIPHVITDADVTAANAAVMSMLASEFPTDVVVADFDAALGKNPAYFGADGIHPNPTGNARLAAAVATAVSSHY